MIVFAVDDDPAVLDLVVHFLGIATHHNVNAAPSEEAPEVNSRAEEKPEHFARYQDVGGLCQNNLACRGAVGWSASPDDQT